MGNPLVCFLCLLIAIGVEGFFVRMFIYSGSREILHITAFAMIIGVLVVGACLSMFIAAVGDRKEREKQRRRTEDFLKSGKSKNF